MEYKQDRMLLRSEVWRHCVTGWMVPDQPSTANPIAALFKASPTYTARPCRHLPIGLPSIPCS